VHTNLVGRSTLVNPWVSHVLDSLQIIPHLKNKNSTILDMGTGAGLPGAILSIVGCKNVTLVDSNGKKINFLRSVKKELLLGFNIILGRVEGLDNIKYDVVTTRALASLEKLFSYSQKFLTKNTVMIFLKGKTVNEEIQEAQKKWRFQFSKTQSISHPDGSVLVVRNLKKND
jgi:16S rRNA (guanine527-N7)-methyltransferase